MIPKVIHYCWFGRNPLSKLSKKCINSWKKYCPDYEIIEWNEDNFDINSNQYVKEAYEAQKWAFVSDYVRLYVLYYYGGIYADTDAEFIKPMDEFLKYPAFSGFESNCDIPTAVMGAEKNNTWIGKLLEYYDDKHFIMSDGTYDMTTNVVTITNITKENYNIKLNDTTQCIEGVFILFPHDFFCPKNYDTCEIKLTANTHAIHHFNGSWHSEEERKNYNKRHRYIKFFGRNVGKKLFFLITVLKKRDGSFKKWVIHFLKKQLKK